MGSDSPRFSDLIPNSLVCEIIYQIPIALSLTEHAMMTMTRFLTEFTSKTFLVGVALAITFLSPTVNATFSEMAAKYAKDAWAKKNVSVQVESDVPPPPPPQLEAP